MRPTDPNPLRPGQTRFDWEDARRLHREGLSYNEIARQLGVSARAVARVCNLTTLAKNRERGRSQESMDRHRQTHTAPCPCGRGIYWKGHGAKHCRQCEADSQVTTVRPTTLKCSCCGEWKPDEEFSRNRSNARQRHRSAECRICDRDRKRRERALPPGTEAARRRAQRRTKALAETQ